MHNTKNNNNVNIESHTKPKKFHVKSEHPKKNFTSEFKINEASIHPSLITKKAVLFNYIPGITPRYVTVEPLLIAFSS